MIIEKKFKVGNRVKRQIDSINKSKGYKEGTITRVYERSKSKYNSDLSPDIEPYLYEVKWDDGKVENGYMSIGLEKIN